MELPVEWRCCSCENQVDLNDVRQCSNCGPRGGNNRQLYCISLCCTCRLRNCTEPGHSSCWEEHLPKKEHMKKLHIPIDPLPSLYVYAVTYSESDPGRQRRLHEQDRIAQWFTIKVDNSITNTPRLCVTDRFRQLCDPGVSGSKWSKRQYPGFVSFIGNTGIGKSTILRAMILMGQVDPSGAAYELDEAEGKWKTTINGFRSVLAGKAQSPVSRSGCLEHLTDPTSFGVHLYRDVATSTPRERQTDETKTYDDTPILFADCEGFRAGHATTNAERFSSLPSLPNLISESPITAASYGRHGKEGVDLFYARFLYTVSDVVVFVMSGDTELYHAMQKLVEWAASAVHRSVNHLAHKTLVVVRNMAVLHKAELYNTNTLRSSLFLNLGPLWEGSPILENFRKTFNDKQYFDSHKIDDNSDLLDKFFSDVRFCYIPDASKAPPDQIFKQYQTLRHQIVDASQESQKRRAKAWMQYNVPTLSHILNRALEHFRTSDQPFDFYKAARNDNPNPSAVSDHIANFIRHLHLTPGFPARMISQVITICLVSWALRTFGSVQEPYEMFSRKLENWCREGIEKFSERDQKCGQMLKGGEGCVNRRATHNSEHCDEKGNRSPGSFDEALKLPSDTLNDINTLFVKEYGRLCRGTGRTLLLPSPEQSRQFRENVLQQFKSEWKLVRSNKSCLACLQAVPDNILECGHSFCPPCVREFGRPCNYFESGWVMDHCILCQSTWQDGRHLFRFSPKCGGVRALTLDGGGIRGIVELALLECLDSTMGLEIPLREHFDIIMGTSTGGIIALGIGTKELSIGRLKKEFIALATKTFEKRREGTLVTALDPFKLTSTFFLLLHIWDSVYRTRPLLDGLKKLFGSDQNLFSAARRSVRVAVTSVKDNGADKCLIANYNRPKFGTDQDFEREDDSKKDMKVWEAALATAAAPFYFCKFEKPETKKNYTDGALHANFPVPYALEEIARVWNRSDDEKVPLDILLSIGTGIQKKEISIPVPLKIGGFQEVCTSFHNSLDSQKGWLEFERVRLNESDIQGRVHRLNFPIEGNYVALDHYKRMKDIDASITAQLKDPIFSSHLRKIADTLVANLFFFEPDVNIREISPQGRSEQLSGTIRCRLARDSSNLKNLIDAIDSFWYKESRFSDKRPGEKNQWTAIPLSAQQRNGVKTQGRWLRVECKIAPMEPLESLQILAVSLRRASDDFRPDFPAIPIPISGFPIGFHCLKKKSR